MLFKLRVLAESQMTRGERASRKGGECVHDCNIELDLTDNGQTGLKCRRGKKDSYFTALIIIEWTDENAQTLRFQLRQYIYVR